MYEYLGAGAAMMRTVLLIISVTAMAFLFGCASKPVIQTQVIEKLWPVAREVEMPAECKDAMKSLNEKVREKPSSTVP